MKQLKKTIDVEVDDTFSADVTLTVHEMVQFFEACSARKSFI